MTTQQQITPHLWFDKEAVEAARLYTSLLPNSAVTNITTLYDTPAADCDIVSFTLAGQEFMAISAGPLFQFNPLIDHPRAALCGRSLWPSRSSDGFLPFCLQRCQTWRACPLPAGMAPDKEGTIMFTDFTLRDQWFVAMDSAQEHNFAFILSSE